MPGSCSGALGWPSLVPPHAPRQALARQEARPTTGPAPPSPEPPGPQPLPQRPPANAALALSSGRGGGGGTRWALCTRSRAPRQPPGAATATPAAYRARCRRRAAPRSAPFAALSRPGPAASRGAPASATPPPPPPGGREGGGRRAAGHWQARGEGEAAPVVGGAGRAPCRRAARGGREPGAALGRRAVGGRSAAVGAARWTPARPRGP